MIQRDTQLSWARRLEEKLRAVYATLTCGRSSDVYHHRPAQRPPRPSRPQVPLHPPPHRYEPRPRYAPPPDQPGGSSWGGYVPSPPHPDQAGGSSWQRHTPTPSPPDRTGGSPWQRQMGWHDHPQPDGTYYTPFYCTMYNVSLIIHQVLCSTTPQLESSSRSCPDPRGGAILPRRLGRILGTPIG